jgi:hypothetical protein
MNMLNDKLTMTDEFKNRMISGTLTEILVARKKKGCYMKFDGIRITFLSGHRMRISLLWRELELSYMDTPGAVLPGDTLTIQGAGIEGRSPFTVE